jgi:hypothetical protein
LVLFTTCNLIKDKDRGLPYLWSKAGVANLFLQVGQMQDPQNVHRAKIWFKETLTDQIFSSFKANKHFFVWTALKVCSGHFKSSGGSKMVHGPHLGHPWSKTTIVEKQGIWKDDLLFSYLVFVCHVETHFSNIMLSWERE